MNNAMISIARYLRRGEDVQTGLDSAVLTGLCAGILNYVGAYVFAGEFSRLRPPLEEQVQALSEEPDEPALARIDESVRVVLSDYSRLARENAQKTAIEMHQMVGILGQALTALSGGGERSVTRLQTIQDTIRRTSAIQDVSVLRESLRDLVRLVGEESSKEQQTRMQEREAIEVHVVRFRDLVAGNPNRSLQGREEAIRTIAESRDALSPGKSVWVIAFVFAQLPAIVRRYGAEAVDDLFFQLIQERMLPLAPACTAFRWGPSGIVGVAGLEADRTDLQNQMARMNQTPLVCRIALGSRTASVKVGLSHLLLDAFGDRSQEESPMDVLIPKIDSFIEAGAA